MAATMVGRLRIRLPREVGRLGVVRSMGRRRRVRSGGRGLGGRQALVEDRPPYPALGALGNGGLRWRLVGGETALLGAVPSPPCWAAHPGGRFDGLGRASFRDTATLFAIPELILLASLRLGSDEGSTRQLRKGDESKGSK
jgi:hypothetical protein